MPISEIPIFSMLRTRMQWHQERQQLLSENVSNANTPDFRPRDLAPLDLTRPRAAGARAEVARLRHSIACVQASRRFDSTLGANRAVMCWRASRPP